MLWKKGFTMVELLVVLIILAILVAVAAPMYFANVNRARASEAVAAIGTIRQALRDYRVSHGSYPPANIADITLPPSSTAVAGGVGVDTEVTQYFSNGAYSVTLAGTPAWAATMPSGTLAAVDFVISANSNSGVACTGTPTQCAMKYTDVDAGDTIRLQMDNSGRVFVAYNDSTTYEPY